MTTDHHTPHPFGNAVDSAEFNSRLGELDAAIGTAIAAGFVDAATTLDAQAASGQKVLPVASTTGFIVGDSVWVGTPGSGLQETGVIASISAGVSLTLVANLANTHAIGAPVSRSPAEVVDARGTFTTLGGRIGLIESRIFDVRLYGALGDGTTDDTSAISAAIAAFNAAGGGALYFPKGHYKVTAALTSITAGGRIFGDGMSSRDGTTNATSRISCTSATAALFTIAAHSVQIEGLALVNTAGSAPTAGGGVVVTVGDHFRILSCTVSGFWINVDIQDGAQWRMSGCYLRGPKKYALKVRHVDLPDGGDWSVSDSWFYARDYAADAAIRVESSGGGKITNCKINADMVTTFEFVHGIDVAPSADASLFMVSNTSIENVSGDGIRVINTVGNIWPHLVFSGLQIGHFSPNATGNGIVLTANASGDLDHVAITGCVFRATASSGYAIVLTNINRVVVSGNSQDGFAGLVMQTGCTNIAGVWVSFTPVWASAGTQPVIGNGTLTGRYRALDGNYVSFIINFKAGSTSTYGTGAWSFSTPFLAVVGKKQVASAHLLDDGTDHMLGVGIMDGTGAGVNYIIPEAGLQVSNNVPHTWAVNDEINLSGTIEV